MLYTGDCCRLGSPTNSFTVNISVMQPRGFLLIFLRNRVPGVEFLEQSMYVFKKIDLAKLPSEKIVTLYISAGSV